jgi:hypothetical protein
VIHISSACQTPSVRRDLGDGFELDDDPGRIDLGAVHRCPC